MGGVEEAIKGMVTVLAVIAGLIVTAVIAFFVIRSRGQRRGE